MKTITKIFILLIVTLSSCTVSTEKKTIVDKDKEDFWNLEKAKKQAAAFDSPEKWDRETLKMEVANIEEYEVSTIKLPLYKSPFPTPNYSSPGNGYGPIETEIGGKRIIGQYVIMGEGKHSEYLFKNTADNYITYFTVLTIADSSNTNSRILESNPMMATSRNHPHYLSQGTLNYETKSRIDWIAVQLANGQAYAIINTRIFDLRIGRVILVAPQKDGSIRFYQTKTSAMDTEQRQQYLGNLKNNKEIVKFFTQENNI